MLEFIRYISVALIKVWFAVLITVDTDHTAVLEI